MSHIPSTSTSKSTPPHRISATLLFASLMTVLLGACASVPPPTEQMAVAEAAVQRANTRTTTEFAASELQIASNKLTSARQAMVNKDYDRARQLAEQVDVDAQVAELRAQSTISRKAAQESRDAARVLLEEINRKSIR